MKSKMDKLPHLAGVGASEQNLFHGTPDEATVRCICYQNFDPRMHGRHGTVYGNGIYFSTTAKYSHQYTQKNAGRRFMFLARAVVGKPILGKPGMNRPPPVDPSRPHGVLFDSCVNSISNPSIFVIFDNEQCYPEFLIEYELCKVEGTGGVAQSSGAHVTMSHGSASASAAYTSLASSRFMPSTRAASPVPIRVSSAVGSQAPAPSPTGHQSRSTHVSSSPVSTATQSQPASTTSTAAASAQESGMGCLLM